MVTLYSAVQMKAVKGCVICVRDHTTSLHVYLDIRVCAYIESYGEHEEEVCDDDEVVWPCDPVKLGGGRIFRHF